MVATVVEDRALDARCKDRYGSAAQGARRWTAPLAALTLALATAAVQLAAQTPAWTAHKHVGLWDADARPADGDEILGKGALAVDGDGNVYVTGRQESPGTGTGADYLTVAYDSAGNLLWTQRRDGGSGGRDIARAIAVAGGIVFVTGSAVVPGSGEVFLTVAYDRQDGHELWVRAKRSQAGGATTATALAVDELGNVYVTGQGRTAYLYWEWWEYLTVAYDSAGNELWSRTKRLGEWAMPQAAAASQGMVYVTGYGGTTNENYLTVAYDGVAGTELWARTEDGVGHGDDRAYGLTVAGALVVVTGRSWGGTSSFDLLTVAYDTAGTRQWASVENGAGNGNDAAFAVADGPGPVFYVTGESDGGPSQKDFLTVAYDGSGNELWAAAKDRGGNDAARAIACVGPSGVHVTGLSDHVVDAIVVGTDLLTVLYGDDGGEIASAVKQTDGTSSHLGYALAGGGGDKVHVAGYTLEAGDADFEVVTYDRNLLAEEWTAVERPWVPSGEWLASSGLAAAGGNVYVTGITEVGADWITVAYDPGGNELWTRTKSGPGDGRASASAVAVGAGQVVVTGDADAGATAWDVLTVAYDGSGNELWARTKDSGANRSDSGRAIAIDGSGNVYVTGYTGSGSASDFLTLAYDRDGNELWARTRNGAGNADDYADAIALDASGNVYVAGTSWNGSRMVLLTIAYDSGGNELWARIAPETGYASGANLAAGAGGVYLTGSVHSPGSGYDFLTVAYAADGTERWSRTLDFVGRTDQAAAVAVDSAENVYVTGSSEDSSYHWDYFTAAYDQAGNQLWARRKDGPAHGSDVAVALAIDAEGKVYAVGASYEESSRDCMVVAYDRLGTELWDWRYENLLAFCSAAASVERAVYVAGYAVGQGQDLLTVKFGGPCDPTPDCAQAGTACATASCDATGAAGNCALLTPVAAGPQCRAAVDACDVAEACDGTGTDCPADVFAAAGLPCGDPASGVCDDADSCDGAGACLLNHRPDGTVCGDDGLECEVADTCDDGVCLDRGFEIAGTACGDPGAGACTEPDSCDGAGACLRNHLECGWVGAGSSCGFDALAARGVCRGGAADGEECVVGDAAGECVSGGGACEPARELRLVYTPDVKLWPAYKLNTGNPGQLSYNLFVAGEPGAEQTVTVAIPYPFVTQGSLPVKVYDAAATGNDGDCFLPPAAALGESDVQVTLADWLAGTVALDRHHLVCDEFEGPLAGAPAEAVCLFDVVHTVPPSGMAYVAVHLDYGLEGTAVDGNPGDRTVDRYDRGGLDPQFGGSAALRDVPSSDETQELRIAECQPYAFEHSVAGLVRGGDTVASTNAFKKIAGAFGLVARSADGSAVAGVALELLDGSGKVVRTAVSDEDGFYALPWSHKGKPASYTVRLLGGYGLSRAIQLKSGGWAEVTFDVSTGTSSGQFGFGEKSR
jgi:hypothetical protein